MCLPAARAKEMGNVSATVVLPFTANIYSDELWQSMHVSTQ
jgi:hypothetical protein